MQAAACGGIASGGINIWDSILQIQKIQPEPRKGTFGVLAELPLQPSVACPPPAPACPGTCLSYLPTEGVLFLFDDPPEPW